jgi:monoamine oxidase
MPHTTLGHRLRNLASLTAETVRRETARGSVPDASPLRGTSRRAFLGSLILGSTSLAAQRTGAATPVTAGRVAIVGGGLAGLTCAHRLRQAGIAATVYEANTRLGGRCWTRRNDFAEGQTAEHGGELIDQGHTRIRQLAQELNLDLDNMLAAEARGTEPCYFFRGAPYTYGEATADMKVIWQKLHRDLSEAGYPTLYHRFTRRGYELDHLSIVDWIEETVPGGIDSRLGRLFDVAYNIEYGAETHRQSALNLLYLLGYSGPGRLRIFGPSNEKYHVRGGNDQIVSRLAANLADRIVADSALTALRRNPGGSYTLTFASGSNLRDVTADHVVLALPFSMLRRDVDLRRAGLSALKTTAIRELAMGDNSKLNVQFSTRPWNRLGCSGDTFADTGYQATWEVTRAQAGSAGILVDYTGGDYAATFGRGTPAERARHFLAQVDPVLPGIGAAWNGAATVDFWTGNPFSRGSYSFWQVGQYTRFAGIEGVREANLHFCGEHTSIDAQGYLEGAVETGERAATEILDDAR